MGELTDKIKGNIDEAIGKAKQVIAGDPEDRSASDEKLAAEGKGQELTGKGEQFKGSVKGALGDNI